MGLQLEQMWLQLRVLGIIAALYGHDVNSVEVQQQIILCLMDAVAGQAQSGKIRSEMERIALTQICKKLVLGMTGSSTLGGLYNGITSTVRGQWSGGRPPPELIDRAKKHFRPRSQLTISVTQATGLILLSLVAAKLVTVFRILIELPSVLFKGSQLTVWFIVLFVCAEVAVLVPIVGGILYGALVLIRRLPSVLPVAVFGGMGLLQTLIAYNMALDFVLFFRFTQTAFVTAIYHGSLLSHLTIFTLLLRLR
eukprot:SAG31_NODE_545_length_14238_cov_15.518849_12_plen_252_part_00